MMGFAFTLAPDTHNTDLITMVTTDIATTVTRTNIGGRSGTGTIIGTITTKTTTGIESYEIIAFCPCAGVRRIDFSIL
jgi:hypothetical protein